MTLVDRSVGASQIDFTQTFFEDTAGAVFPGAVAAPYTGTFRPVDTIGLRALWGQSVAGQWDLLLYDHTSGVPGYGLGRRASGKGQEQRKGRVRGCWNTGIGEAGS